MFCWLPASTADATTKGHVDPLRSTLVRTPRHVLTDHGLGKVSSPRGDDKELLEGELVAGVFASVDNVETGDGKRVRHGVAGHFGIVLPERHTTAGSTGLTSRQGDCRKKKEGRPSCVSQALLPTMQRES
jgi:hypothetical protein